MFSHYAYMKEAGNYQFMLDNQDSKNFIVTFIVIKKEESDELREKVKWLLLGIDERSKKQKVIESMAPNLADLSFSIFSFVLNKERLRDEGGFGDRQSLFAYLNKEIYDNLFDGHRHMQVQVMKESSPYIDSFVKYIEERQQPDLFNSSAFSFIEQADDELMKLAKLISDVLLDEYTDQKESTFLNELAERVIRIKLLPDFQLDFDLDGDGDLDDIIARYAISEAESYIRQYEKSKVQVNRDRVNFLKFLLTQLSIKPREYVYSQEIIDNIRRFSPDSISKEYLMRDITGPLRDAGLLIASTSKGYKIPVSKSDLLDYVNFSSSMALPMLRRIEKSREIILRETDGEVDILEEEEFKELKEFFIK